MVVRAAATETRGSESVRFELEVKVKNTSDADVRNYRGGQAFDFLIEDDSGQVVWLWSAELLRQQSVFTQELKGETFSPGDVKTGRAIWHANTCADPTPGSAGPGRYKVRALWVSSQLDGGGGDERAWWSDPVMVRL